eukprot:scaffold105454_cov17-Tisochrysis_lutea.AAC.1
MALGTRRASLKALALYNLLGFGRMHVMEKSLTSELEGKGASPGISLEHYKVSHPKGLLDLGGCLVYSCVRAC